MYKGHLVLCVFFHRSTYRLGGHKSTGSMTPDNGSGQFLLSGGSAQFPNYAAISFVVITQTIGSNLGDMMVLNTTSEQKLGGDSVERRVDLVSHVNNEKGRTGCPSGLAQTPSSPDSIPQYTPCKRTTPTES